MITLTDDEIALIRSLLTALRTIKVRDIDKALVILSKGDRPGRYREGRPSIRPPAPQED